MKPKEVLKQLNDYILRSYIAAAFSAGINIAFLAYNLFLGVVYRAVWNLSICGYYFMLIVLRTVIIWNERKWHKTKPDNLYENRANLFRTECSLLLVLDFAMIIPIALMVVSRRQVNAGMIPAITIAAYTTYKITMAVINYKKTRNHDDLSLYGLKIINLKDALVSILTLQNTMIMVFGNKESMLKLGAYTSAGILGLMIVITVLLRKRAKSLGSILRNGV